MKIVFLREVLYEETDHALYLVISIHRHVLIIFRLLEKQYFTISLSYIQSIKVY